MDDVVEIDEVIAAEQGVDLGLAGGVPPHKPPEGRGLIGRVVIDVHPGVLRTPGPDEVDHAPKHLGLLGVSHGPPRPVLRRAGGIDGHHPEEILATAFNREWIAFEIEEDIAGVRLGQPLQPLALDHWTKLMKRRQEATRRELDLRLIAHA